MVFDPLFVLNSNRISNSFAGVSHKKNQFNPVPRSARRLKLLLLLLLPVNMTVTAQHDNYAQSLFIPSCCSSLSAQPHWGQFSVGDRVESQDKAHFHLFTADPWIGWTTYFGKLSKQCKLQPFICKIITSADKPFEDSRLRAHCRCNFGTLKRHNAPSYPEALFYKIQAGTCSAWSCRI